MTTFVQVGTVIIILLISFYLFVASLTYYSKLSDLTKIGINVGFRYSFTLVAILISFSGIIFSIIYLVTIARGKYMSSKEK